MAMLTQQELYVLKLISIGLIDKEIALRVGVSYNRVKAINARIRGKLGVHNRAHAVNIAMTLKLLGATTPLERR